MPYAWGEAAMSHALEKGGIPSGTSRGRRSTTRASRSARAVAVMGARHMALLSNENVLNKASDLIGEFAK